MHIFTSIDDKRLALDLRTIRAVLDRDRGVQLVTSDDLYMVKGEFIEIVDMVEKAKEGTA
jgi:hypothetical protein